MQGAAKVGSPARSYKVLFGAIGPKLPLDRYAWNERSYPFRTLAPRTQSLSPWP